MIRCAGATTDLNCSLCQAGTYGKRSGACAFASEDTWKCAVPIMDVGSELMHTWERRSSKRLTRPPCKPVVTRMPVLTRQLTRGMACRRLCECQLQPLPGWHLRDRIRSGREGERMELRRGIVGGPALFKRPSEM